MKNNLQLGMLSDFALAIAPSETLLIGHKARHLAADGVKVINFGLGEPDFNAPDDVKEAMHEAIKNNKTRYTNSQGILDLRAEISRKLKDKNNLDYHADDIIVCNGAKQAIHNALLATINPKDEVLIIKPYWTTYIEQVKMCNALPVIVESNPDFSLNIDAIKNAITKHTKAIIINSPNNPCGAVYSEDSLRALSKIIIENNMLAISDEIYEHIIYEGKHHSIASLNVDIKSRTIDNQSKNQIEY